MLSASGLQEGGHYNDRGLGALDGQYYSCPVARQTHCREDRISGRSEVKWKQDKWISAGGGLSERWDEDSKDATVTVDVKWLGLWHY